MTFRRIDEDTISYIVTTDEMQEYGIEVEDFFRDREKVHGFLEMVLKEAVEEVGEMHHHGVMSMQIMPMSKNCISITFSEKSVEMGLSELLESIRRSMEELQTEIPKELQGIFSGSMQSNESGAMELPGVPGIEKSLHKGKPEQKEPNDGIICFFGTLEDLGDFCKKAPTGTVESRLYKEERIGYYMVLIQKEDDPAGLQLMTTLASEYVGECPKAGIGESYLREHCTCMIEECAIEQMQKVFLQTKSDHQ